MEKFALLNLLKAIDGLKNLSGGEKEPPPPAPQPPQGASSASQNTAMPNIMYEAMMRHEAVSNRIRNRK